MAGPPMTLGNMRTNGVRSLDVSCWLCHQRAIMSADLWPDHVQCGSSRHPLFQTLSPEGPVGRSVIGHDYHHDHGNNEDREGYGPEQGIGAVHRLPT
jgi:hypothetical protein